MTAAVPAGVTGQAECSPKAVSPYSAQGCCDQARSADVGRKQPNFVCWATEEQLDRGSVPLSSCPRSLFSDSQMMWASHLMKKSFML